MSQKGYGRRINHISDGQIVECYEANESLLERLEGAHEKFLERTARIQVASQSQVMKYVVEALLEEDDDEELTLTEDDKGFLFLILKTVIDVLNKTTHK